MNASSSRRPRVHLRAVSAGAIGLLLWTAGALAQKPGPLPADRRPAAPRVRVLKSWQDSVKIDGKEIERRLEMSYDYDRGLATLRIFSAADGSPISSQDFEHGPRPSAEEMEEAVSLLLADEQIGSIMRSRSAVVEGGFLLEEKPGEPCGPRTRCLQIQLLSPDRIGLIRWAVVDLTKRQIVYPVYVPSSHGVKK